LITSNEYTAPGSVTLRPVFTGGYETVYGSTVAQNPVITPGMPMSYALTIYPNPFNTNTMIEYALARSGKTDISVYDLNGRKITTLAGGEQKAGYYQIVWPGLDKDGQRVATGVYFIRIVSDGYIKQEKVLRLK
jgi:hypothetical protein